MAFSAGQILTAAELNDRVPESAKTAWGSPISSGITTGSGTTAAYYYQVGPITFYYFKFTLGAGSAVTGDVTIDLPVDSIVQRFHGAGYLEDITDTTARTVASFIQLGSNATAAIRANDATVSYSRPATLSATIPFTWASGDIMLVNGWYFHA